MKLEDIIIQIIIVVFFYSISIALFILGLKFLGIIKKSEINPNKWTKTTAKVKESKIIKTKAIGKHSNQYEEFVETAIVYRANNLEYKKYIRHISEDLSHICIYYKNKNPNYFKLQSKIKSSEKNQLYSGLFLCFCSVCMFICGCVIVSTII